jgi:CheY-like chemotaxis protein
VDELDDQLRQTSKMEALGRLAAGVAHDFNNLIAAMRGYTELVAATLPPTDPRHDDLDQVLRAADRAAEMTRKLLAFGRTQPLEARVVDPSALVLELAPLLSRLLGEEIELHVVTPPGVGQVAVDPGQFEQAIVNLAVNAREAMPAGGSLTVELFATELGPEAEIGHPEVVPGRYVAIAVSDTGVGMDAETLSHAFEPFYTTRAGRGGTGLGLASVYGFVKQSNGFIYAGSEPGRGTDFTIYLPLADGEIVRSPLHETRIALPRGSESVLVVDDDAAVAELVRRVLDPLGYRLQVTSSAAQAFSVAVAAESPVDLLIADVGVPDVRGPVLADRLREAGRVQRVLLVSGYSEPALSERGELPPDMAFLAKPFTGAQLANKVRATLSGLI